MERDLERSPFTGLDFSQFPEFSIPVQFYTFARSATSSMASLRPGGAPPATPGVASEPMVGGARHDP